MIRGLAPSVTARCTALHCSSGPSLLASGLASSSQLSSSHRCSRSRSSVVASSARVVSRWRSWPGWLASRSRCSTWAVAPRRRVRSAGGDQVVHSCCASASSALSSWSSPSPGSHASTTSSARPLSSSPLRTASRSAVWKTTRCGGSLSRAASKSHGSAVPTTAGRIRAQHWSSASGSTSDPAAGCNPVGVLGPSTSSSTLCCSSSGLGPWTASRSACGRLPSRSRTVPPVSTRSRSTPLVSSQASVHWVSPSAPWRCQAASRSAMVALA